MHTSISKYLWLFRNKTITISLHLCVLFFLRPKYFNFFGDNFLTNEAVRYITCFGAPKNVTKILSIPWTKKFWLNLWGETRKAHVSIYQQKMEKHLEF